MIAFPTIVPEASGIELDCARPRGKEYELSASFKLQKAEDETHDA